MATIRDFKKFDSARNILIPDITVDSDLSVKVQKWTVTVDSDFHRIRLFESDFSNMMYKAGGVLESLDSESKKGQKHSLRIDSEYRRVSAHYYEVQKLLDSEYIKNRELLADVAGRLDSDESAIQAKHTAMQNLLDSEYVKNRQQFVIYNRRLDSDETALQHAKTHLENLLDSEYRQNRDNFDLLWARLDSDEEELQSTKTYLENLLDSEYAKNREMLAYIEGRLDSDETALQAAKTHLENLLDSEYVKNRQMLAYIEGRLDSDETALQAAKTHLENLLDSEYAKNRQMLAYIEGRLDSDETALQAAKTDLENRLDSEYRKSADWYAYAEQRMDSDEQKLQDNLTYLENRIDSEYVKNREMLAYIEGRIDSDETAIQSNLTYLEDRIDSEYAKNRDWFAYAQQRLDSDETAIQHISSKYVKTVNGISADINNNVILSIVGVQTGTDAQRVAAEGTDAIGEGDVWVVSGDPNPLEDGKSYIFDSDGGVWRRVSGFDLSEGDARYVNVSGDTMAGGLTVPSLQVDSGEVVGVSPSVTLTGAVTGTGTLTDLNNVSIVTTHTADPVITLTGAVTGSGTMTNLGNVTINTTATPDPKLTITGDASGIATFTNLGNATLNLSLTKDPVITLAGAVTGSATMTNLGDVTITTSADPVITLTGAVTGSGTMTSLGNVSIATTATNDPTLTLAGDVTGSATFTNLGNATLTATVVESNVNHDLLSNFVGDEHINHSTVLINAGNGLTGGGTIAASRTLHVGAGTGISVAANSISTNDSQIVHDNLSGFVANEHINHGSVSITAGNGLTGGGTIAASRTINVGAGTGITVNANDIAVNAGAVDHNSLLNYTANRHIDHSSVSITAGNGLTGGGTIQSTRTLTVQASDTSITVGTAGISVNEAGVNHDTLQNFVANEHINHSSVSIIAGAGLTGGGTIASSRTLNVVGGNGISVGADSVTMSGSYTGNFSVTGTVFATVDVTVTSDERLKSNVQTIDGTKAFEMRGVHYDIDGRSTSGVIAQEIEKIAPELVHENDEGFKSVAYGPVVAYLIEAVKQLNERVKELESK